MRKRPTRQQHCVYGAEDRCVGPNAQSKDGDGHKRKSRRFSEQAETIQDVSRSGFKPTCKMQLAAFVFDSFNAPKGDLRLSPSLLLRHSVGDVFLKLQFQMKLQFAFEIGFEATSAENSFELHRSPSRPVRVTHCPAPVRSRPTFCATLKVPLPVESAQSE